MPQQEDTANASQMNAAQHPAVRPQRKWLADIERLKGLAIILVVWGHTYDAAFPAWAIDLRQAHWLWIHDLSARDPIFLLPAVMVLSMFLIQRITPQAGMDPAQQRMMNIMMPAMMGFIFFNLPAGLNLYYAESNLISMAQQWIMNKTGLGREMRESAAKRARKKDK